MMRFILVTKQPQNSGSFLVASSYYITVKLAAKVLVPVFILLLQYGPPESSGIARLCMLITTFVLA